ncbi:MAG: hypothetical protein M3Y87_37200, partial [Myxococcota bacterium]|nr:hypothetical protein [Myxococcota bacterium]
MLHAPTLAAAQSALVAQPMQRAPASSHISVPAHGEPACALHDPAAQVSKPLQNTPSSQAAVFGVNTQPDGSQVSSVQGFESSQSAGVVHSGGGPPSIGPASLGGPPSPPSGTAASMPASS